MSVSIEKIFWNLYAITYDSANCFKPYQNLITESIDIINSENKPQSKILDAGCGTGNFSIALAKKGYKVIGIDFAESMLKQANKKKDGLKNLEFKKGDLQRRLDFEDSTFDYVLNIHSLYMLSKPEYTLQEFYRVLKPEGKLIIANPQVQFTIPLLLKISKETKHIENPFANFFWLVPLSIFKFPVNAVIWWKMKKGKYFYWTQDEFSERLMQANFTVETIKETYVNNIVLLGVAKKT